MNIIGFTADADFWCPDCASAVYGPDIWDDQIEVLDSEQNPIHPVFALDEEPDGGWTCGHCRISERLA